MRMPIKIRGKANSDALWLLVRTFSDGSIHEAPRNQGAAQGDRREGRSTRNDNQHERAVAAAMLERAKTGAAAHKMTKADARRINAAGLAAMAAEIEKERMRQPVSRRPTDLPATVEEMGAAAAVGQS